MISREFQRSCDLPKCSTSARSQLYMLKWRNSLRAQCQITKWGVLKLSNNGDSATNNRELLKLVLVQLVHLELAPHSSRAR